MTVNKSGLASPILTTKKHSPLQAFHLSELFHYKKMTNYSVKSSLRNNPPVEKVGEFVLAFLNPNVYLVVTLAIDFTHSLWLSGSSVPNR